MTTYTITTVQNYTDLANKTGVDLYNINGGTLTQDSDSRYGPNCNTSSGYGNLSISAALGGTWNIDGTKIYAVPFQSGTGVVPAYSTSIVQGLASAELLCVMSDRWGGTIYLPGQAMPTTGYIKVRNKTGSFTIGSLQNINAFCNAADERSFILVAGAYARTFSVPRLGTMNVTGDWWQVGVTNGLAGQMFRLPFVTAEQNVHYPLVEVETAPGSGEYIQYHNAGIRMLSSGVGNDTRCRLVYISTNGELYFGQGYDGSPCGHVPAAGCLVRIPNIVFQTSGDTAGTYAINPALTTDPGARYEAVYSSAGVLNHDKSTGAWYWNVNQPYQVDIKHLHTCDKINLTEVSSFLKVDELHVGVATMASDVTTQAITIQQCYFGGSIGRISGVKARCTGTAHYAVVLINLYGGFTFKDVFGRYTENATAVAGPVQINTCKNLTFDVLRGIGKRIIVMGCKNTWIKKLIKADNQFGTTVAAVASRAIEVSLDSSDVSIDAYENWDNLPNVHPYEALLFCNTAQRVKFRNAGTALSPLSAGTVTATNMAYVYVDGGNNEEINIQRVWVSGLRTGLYSSTNTSTLCKFENIYNEDAAKINLPNMLNSLSRGNRHNNGTVGYSYTSVYGTHFWDGFISDTATRLSVIYVEPTVSTTSQCTIVSGSPKFTAQGELVMDTLGDTVVWEMPYFMLGWTGITTWGVAGTNHLTKHNYEYDIDKGSGFSGTYKTLTNVNLTAETGISPTIGIRFKIKVNCTSTDATNKIRSFYIDGTTTRAIQNAALYPLDTVSITLTGVQPGTLCAVFEEASYVDGVTSLATASTSSNTVTLTFSKPITNTYKIRLRKPGYGVVELIVTNTNLKFEIPVFQVENRDGFGIPIYGRGPGTTKTYVTVNPTNYRIDIANFRVIGEDLYDVIADWQATPVGISYPEVLRFDGVDGLLMFNWRLRRAQIAYTSAGIDMRVFVDGSMTGSPDDETNGSIDILAKTVRTYNTSGQTTLTKEDIAQAVWTYVQLNGLSAETNLLDTKTNATNAFAAAISIG